MNNTTVTVATGNIVLGEGVHTALTVVIGTALPMGVLFELVIIVKGPSINDIRTEGGRWFSPKYRVTHLLAEKVMLTSVPPHTELS